MMVEIQALSLTPPPQPKEEEEEEDLMTLSQRFQRKFKTNPSHLSKKLQMRPGAKRKGHSWGTLTKMTGPERSTGTKRFKRTMTDKRMFDGRSESRISAIMERAGEVQSSLDPEFPSFFKLMLRSHVGLGFQMKEIASCSQNILTKVDDQFVSFPQDFCRLHLPKSDTTIILEGEDGVEYKTKFLFSALYGKVGLSGGWRGFSLAHKLLEGDVVVFHLVLPCKFKVYIVRANELAKVDGALTPAQLDDSTSATDFACNEKPMRRCEQTIESHQMPLFPDIHQEIPEVNDKMVVNSYLAPEADECANSRALATPVTSEDMDISELSNMSNPFGDFKIIVSGTIIDSELSKDLQTRYYELCCSRNFYLLENLKGISQKLAAVIISETMDIADAIRASNHSTCLDDYKALDKTLKALEILGMDVGFLRVRLNRLMDLELKLLELKETSHGLEKEMKSVKEKSARYKMMFQEEASAAW